ncbi:MAG: pantetheine-phosphate adenylyltransferase [Dongiaceae bacterium]
MLHPRIAVYPGTFDPITFGHADVIQRACKLVDKLVIGVAANAGKDPLFSLNERVDLIRGEIKAMRLSCEIAVKPFDNLLMDFATEEHATVLIRGLRVVSDFEYEFQMAGMNAKLNPDIEAVFLMADAKLQLISSRFVKEIARLGGDVTHFVSEAVAHALWQKFFPGAVAGKRKI